MTENVKPALVALPFHLETKLHDTPNLSAMDISQCIKDELRCFRKPNPTYGAPSYQETRRIRRLSLCLVSVRLIVRGSHEVVAPLAATAGRIHHQEARDVWL